MKFVISSVCYYNAIETMLGKYPCLHEFGFHIQEIRTPARYRIRDENGDLIWQDYEKITRVAYIVINNIEELMKLREAVDEELIIGEDYIEIYDGYRE